jgi:hypothetical protein
LHIPVVSGATGDDDEKADLRFGPSRKRRCMGGLLHPHLRHERADCHLHDLLFRGELHDQLFLM